MLSVVITALLIVSVGATLPVKADTDVSVYTVGDVNLTVEIVDGSLTLTYNGRDILAEINSLKSSLWAVSSSMSYLATKTDVGALNQTVGQLIGELDLIFNDVYGKTNLLAGVLGISSNSSAVSLNLNSGDYTFVSYLDGILSNLDETNTELAGTYNELVTFENYAEGRFNATYLEIESLGNYTDIQLNNLYNELDGELQGLEASTLQVVNSTYIELNELRESLRQDVLADLLTLESLIQEGENKQAITEMKLDEVESRFDAFVTAKEQETRTLNIVLIVAALGTILPIASVYIVKKKRKNSTAKP